MRYQGTPKGMMDFLSSQTDDEDRNVKLSRSEALALLKEHGFAPTDLTEYSPGPAYTPSPGSSFDDMMGIRKTYTKREVKLWLGY